MVELSERTYLTGSPRSVSVSMISRILQGTRGDPAISIVLALEWALGCRLNLTDATKESPVINDLKRFQETPLGKSLDLRDDEIADLEKRPWYGHEEHPTDDEWYAHITLRRKMKARRAGEAGVIA